MTEVVHCPVKLIIFFGDIVYFQVDHLGHGFDFIDEPGFSSQ